MNQEQNVLIQKQISQGLLNVKEFKVLGICESRKLKLYC